MVMNSKTEVLKTVKQRKYLNKDFDEFKATLLEHARTFFPNSVRDFSEAGFGGLNLDFAAYVGDVLSFYLDYQFHELDPEYATELRNIQNILRNSGVPIVGASPAVVSQTFYVEIPATTDSPPVPSPAALPIIRAGTVAPGIAGVQYELVDDIDFNEKDVSGELEAKIAISKTDANNVPTAFILSRQGICISGFRDVETFSVGGFEPFKKHTLAKENITEIISVSDNQGNIYYEVGHLTQDTVFEAIINKNTDNKLVKENLVVTPAPFRFAKQASLETRLSTLIFGGGSAQSLDDDIIPDPSEFALPLYGKKNFSRFTLNPGNLLQTTTLGVIAPDSSISMTYRYGGGLSHNAAPKTIRGISTLLMTFPNNPSASVAQYVRSSADSLNEKAATGGEDAPTADELKLRAPAMKASQGRIVSKPDLIARVYTMPSNFGRVFRASSRPNPHNPLSSVLYTISRDENSKLILSPDSLKENVSVYLNEYRLTTDATDILDAKIINLVIEFSIVVSPGQNKNIVKQNVIKKLKDFFNIKNFEIDQPIFLNDVENIIYNTDGVLSLNELKLSNITGAVTNTNGSTRTYSNVQFDVQANTEKKIVFGPPGSIFEIKFGDFDIIGVVVT